MDLSVREVAKLLNVSEETVYRWVHSGSLKSHRVDDQYRFNRVEIQEWAAQHNHRVSPELLAPGGTSGLPSLHAAISRGGVFHGVPGERREDVLEAVAELPGIPPGVDRRMLHQLLVAREALASTGVGGGIAIPHPRDPVVVQVEEPLVLLCFLKEPVDFQAIDALPVRVLFMALSPSVRAHLQILARLAFALHDKPFTSLLRAAAPGEAVLDRLRAIEQGEGAPAAGPEIDDGRGGSKSGPADGGSKSTRKAP